MKWGDKLEWFISLAEDGHIVPALKNMPSLYPDLEQYWEAFQTLTLTRQAGFGTIGPILLSEIQAYLVLYDVDSEEWSEWARWIKYIDTVYLNTLYNKEKENVD